MALSQLFWDVLMPWNLKSTYFSLKMIHFLSLNIWYVIYVVFWIKYRNLKLPHHCILFLFTICTVSQLFWNRVCILNSNVRLLKSMFISIHSILGWVSFCMNYCFNAAWYGGNQPVALLRCNASPGCFDSDLQVICIVGSGVSHLPLDNIL